MKATAFMVWVAGALAVFAGQPSNASAGVMSFDFSSEPGGNFSEFNDAGLYSITTAGGELRISKPADDGSYAPNGFIEAGLLSHFTLAGDFTVKVDFTLYDLPYALGQRELNESLMAVVAANGNAFEDLRFTVGDGRNLVEAFDSPYTGLPTYYSSLASGVYQISRVGSTISGAIAASESSPFVSLGSASGFSDPMRVQLFAAQGENSGNRSTTAIDIGFTGLTIEADQLQGVQGAVPEPSSIVLWAVLLGGGAAIRQFRRTRRGSREKIILGHRFFSAVKNNLAQIL